MRTPLYDEHVKAGASIVDFHGWDMPLFYSGIIREHNSVRSDFGFFDVSHMGDVIVCGRDSGAFLDYILPTKVTGLASGKAAYTAFLDTKGNIIDDTIVYRLSEDRFFFVPNASTTGEIYSWVTEKSKGFEVEIINVSDRIASIALQGPNAHVVSEKMGFREPEPFTFFTIESKFENPITGRRETIISGTGYTGERGMELIMPAEEAAHYWQKMMEMSSTDEGLPCGLGPRDTLRMEKGMLLSGTDFDHNRTPYEASISFIVNKDHEFIGKEPLEKSREERTEIFRGFRVEGRSLPRGGCRILKDGRQVGTVTSGGTSPVLGIPIALGFIDRSLSKEGNSVDIEIRSNLSPATVSKPKLVK